jgi:radical SAM protein with 4Fe4S-binding SPASM domain
MKTIFNEFIQRGKPPFDYINVFLTQYKPHIKNLFMDKKLIPFEIEIQPSPYCNAGCDHCWAKDFNRLENKLESKENINRVVEQVLNINQEGFPNPRIKFCASTGNPTMNKNLGYFVDKFYNKRIMRMFDNGIKIGLNKNNKEYLEDLSKLNFLYLSLDAGTKETLHKIKPGAAKVNVSVEDILEGCKNMKSINPELGVNVSYVITNKNYLDIVRAAKKSKEFGMDLIRYRIDLTENEIPEETSHKIIELLEKAEEYEDSSFKVVPIHSQEEIENKNTTCFGSRDKGFNCITSNVWTCIGSNGNIYPCGHCVDRDTESFGNILEQDFYKIWNGEKRKQVQENLPGKKCTVCSPFSLNINEFGTFLMNLPEFQRDELLEEYYKNKK